MRASKERVALQAVATFEALKGVLVLGLAIGLVSLIHRDLDAVVEHVTNLFRLNPDGRIGTILLRFADKMTDKRLLTFALGAVGYSIIRFVEAYGLWHARAWAEWFALVSGSLYLPFELVSLASHPHPIKCVILIGNLIVVFYMLKLRMDAMAQKRAKVPNTGTLPETSS